PPEGLASDSRSTRYVAAREGGAARKSRRQDRRPSARFRITAVGMTSALALHVRIRLARARLRPFAVSAGTLLRDLPLHLGEQLVDRLRLIRKTFRRGRNRRFGFSGQVHSQVRVSELQSGLEQVRLLRDRRSQRTNGRLRLARGDAD